MSTRQGKSAIYNHYFRNKGDVDTSIKKDAIPYQVVNSKQRLQGRTNVEIYTCVVVIDEKTSTMPDKALIRIKETKEELRVGWTDLTKPGTGGGSLSGRLKPQAVGLDERKYTFQAASDTIVDTIENEPHLTAEMKMYLITLFWYTAGFRGKQTARNPDTITTADLKKARHAIPNTEWTKWQKTIQNDFGEVLGPFALYSYSLLDSASYNKIEIPHGCRIWYPSKPNEKLLDFGVFLKPGDPKIKMMRFSSKAGEGSTNTVKPADIIELLNEPRVGTEKAAKVWKSTPQYKIFEILTEYEPTPGPIMAVKELISSKPSLKRKYAWPGATAANTFSNNWRPANNQQPYKFRTHWYAFAEQQWATGINDNPIRKAILRGQGVTGLGAGKGIKRKDLTAENIRYACEAILDKECHGPRSAVDMNEIFAASIRGKVWYIKFLLGDDGVPGGLWQGTGWAVERDVDYRDSGDVCFRSQNQLDRQKGKIGITPALDKKNVDH